MPYEKGIVIHSSLNTIEYKILLLEILWVDAQTTQIAREQ